jgi:hypothetical protein
MKIIIESIPHLQQRYNTVGDWWFDPDGTLQIRVSEAADERHAFLVAFHELVEVTLCKERGITQAQVDMFDMAFKDEGEPGDDKLAPYYREHQFAMGMERLMAAEMGVDWVHYEAGLDALD